MNQLQLLISFQRRPPPANWPFPFIYLFLPSLYRVFRNRILNATRGFQERVVEEGRPCGRFLSVLSLFFSFLSILMY